MLFSDANSSKVMQAEFDVVLGHGSLLSTFCGHPNLILSLSAHADSLVPYYGAWNYSFYVEDLQISGSSRPRFLGKDGFMFSFNTGVSTTWFGGLIMR